jgi:hypothetical protein
MQVIITLLIIAGLLIIAVQDFSERMISWYTIPLLFILFTCNALQAVPLKEAWTNFIANLAFVLIQLAALTAYFSIKSRKPVNIINTLLGIGDVLLLIVLCTAFSPLNYLLFYLLSLAITIAGYIIYKILKGRSGTIPLAGAVALVLLLCLLYSTITGRGSFYDDALALNVLKIGR